MGSPKPPVRLGPPCPLSVRFRDAVQSRLSFHHILEKNSSHVEREETVWPMNRSSELTPIITDGSDLLKL